MFMALSSANNMAKQLEKPGDVAGKMFTPFGKSNKLHEILDFILPWAWASAKSTYIALVL